MDKAEQKFLARLRRDATDREIAQRLMRLQQYKNPDHQAIANLKAILVERRRSN
jgi:hypothetical protein